MVVSLYLMIDWKSCQRQKNRRGIVLIEAVYNEVTENETGEIELPNFNQLNKKQIIEFGQSHSVDNLDMQMTKKELITTVERSL